MFVCIDQVGIVKGASPAERTAPVGLRALCVYTRLYSCMRGGRVLGNPVCVNPGIVECMGVVSQAPLCPQHALCHTYRPDSQGCSQAGAGQAGERDGHGAEPGRTVSVSSGHSHSHG